MSDVQPGTPYSHSHKTGMMIEITSSNFEIYLPQVKDSIKKCTFIAVDTEFTGLSSDSEYKSSLFDTAENRYNKLRLNLNKFKYVICQFGLTLYLKDPIENEFSSISYTFYLCPTAFASLNRNFSLQSSSLDFHRNNDFNFEKFLKHGISFLNCEEEKLVRDELTRKSFLFNVERELDEWFLQKICSQVSAWICKDEDNELILEYSPALAVHDSGIQKYSLISDLRSRFLTIWACSHNSESIVVWRVTQLERREFEKKAIEDDIKILSILKGFSFVFEELVNCKKPIVGHNFFTDLILMYHQFWKPLPKSYSKFKSVVLSLFPIIYDTKHISSEAQRLKGKRNNDLAKCLSLLDLYTYFSKQVSLSSPSISLQNCEEKVEIKPHDAGFDSFACGYVFLKLADLIGRSSLSETDHHPISWIELMVAMEPFKNKINLIRGASHHLNLATRDSGSNRPPSLHVEMQTMPVNILELTKLFANYGMVDIAPINSKRVLVAMPNIGCAKDLLREFKNNPDFKVSIYDPIKHSPFVRSAMLISCISLISLSAYCTLKLL